ncbi:MAG: hypothetical protein KF726_24645 [Anaerolineae bacterium]|nr:hypothetical protein [Anaerolineae bacterium]
MKFKKKWWIFTTADAHCRKHDMPIVIESATFCADLEMGHGAVDMVALIREQTAASTTVYIWTETAYHPGGQAAVPMYHSEVVPLCSIAEYKSLTRQEIIRRHRAINAQKEAELRDRHQTPPSEST